MFDINICLMQINFILHLPKPWHLYKNLGHFMDCKICRLSILRGCSECRIECFGAIYRRG